MDYSQSLNQTRILTSCKNNNNNKRQKLTDSYPADSTNVNDHFLSKFTGKYAELAAAQLTSFVNHLNNPKENVYESQRLNHYPMNVGYNGYSSAPMNISNVQSYGGSAFMNAGSTNPSDMESDTPYGAKTMPPGSVFRPISPSLAENFHQQKKSFHQGQCQSNPVFPTMANDVQSLYSSHISHNKCNNERSNYRTYLQPQFQMSDPNQRKYDLMEPPSNDSLIESDPLMEVLFSYVNDTETDQLSQDISALQLPPLVDSEDLSVIKTESLAMDSGPAVSSVVMGSTSTNHGLKKSPGFRFEGKNSNQKPETSQPGPKVIRKTYLAPKDHEPLLESRQSMTPSVIKSKKKKPKITSSDNSSGSESLNIKKASTSLAEYLNPSQIKEYLSSLIKRDKEISRSTTLSVSQSPCQLCCEHKLLLDPVPIYCSSCDLRIKQNTGYYQSSDMENTGLNHCFCMKCYKGNRRAINLIHGGSISKTKLHKAKNDEEGEDSWVQCDRCQQWQHRICGLYNDAGDEEGKGEYICPKCLLKQMENGNKVPVPKTFLQAKDLLRTNLSDHIERRLFRRMKQERIETAKFHGTPLENVPAAKGLVVRVVVSVDKELEVKQQFRDIFNGREDYPDKFSYRSKLILLFQKSGGVDLCLFGMYVQEFGSECDSPNNRCVYISYLDSVKYFQPERKTASGEPLRTFVYHEILIGYLEHRKKRGFGSCYIWACPPNGDDYIFYCHPKTQKTPKENKLRQWYKSMIRKAEKDGIVMEQTNLYNQFFVPTNEGGNAKITAARLPYFDGSCWSGIAEVISKKLEEEEKENSGRLYSKLPSKRTWMSIGQDQPTTDATVMQQLGEEILPMKENFMILRLQHTCTYCREVILSGRRWSCNRCDKIQLCSRCFRDRKVRIHSCHSGKKRPVSEPVLCDVPLDTKDQDVVLVNNFSTTRDDFLNQCQKSRYQFDTLGHAKYSSMMILYHFSKSLVVQKAKGDACHTHKLTHPSEKPEPETKSEQQPENQNGLTLNGALEALLHASRCRNIECSYHGCRIIRKLLYHTKKCRVGSRDCKTCTRAWLLLKKHARICRDSDCRVPRCKDLRKNKEECLRLVKDKQIPIKRQQRRPV